MSRRRTARALTACMALLAFPLAGASVTHAAHITTTDGVCTVRHIPAETESGLALSGVFAANWSAEILRDVPSAAEDMTLARTWHADKTSEQLADMPVHIQAALGRINAASARAGYRDGEATAPLRILVERNNHRAAGGDRYTMTPAEARNQLADSRRTGTTRLLSGTREGLSVAAEEAWLRAWERTPGAQTEADAFRAELRMCSAGGSGTVGRDESSPSSGRTSATHVPASQVPGGGVPLGTIHTSLVVALLEDAGSIKGLFH